MTVVEERDRGERQRRETEERDRGERQGRETEEGGDRIVTVNSVR